MERGDFIDAVSEGLTTLGRPVVRFDFPKRPGTASQNWSANAS